MTHAHENGYYNSQFQYDWVRISTVKKCLKMVPRYTNFKLLDKLNDGVLKTWNAEENFFILERI